MLYDVAGIRAQFPVLCQDQIKPRLAYLDSTATTQKPRSVIDAMNNFYSSHYSSVKRGMYRLSEQTTQKFEGTRRRLARFLHAKHENEIVFTRGTTESINLVASCWGRINVQAGDEIVVSALEHHANLVPWQMLAEERQCKLVLLPCDDNADLQLETLPSLLTPRTRLVAVTHLANSTGTTVPARELIALVRKHSNALVLLDAAQSVAHLPINVQELDADFLAFSGHKMYGPTGIGVLWGREELLTNMRPWHGGGEAIERVTFTETIFAPPPARFEAGTPPIAEVIGLGAALDFLENTGLPSISRHENTILSYAKQELEKIPGLVFLGSPKQRSSLLSFTLEGIHPHDAAIILDEEGVALRAGHHCAQPVMDRFGVIATLRASFAAYTESWEIEQLIQALHRVLRLFR